MSNASAGPIGTQTRPVEALANNLDEVRAVIFNTFGTVVDWRSSLIEQFEAFGRERSIRADWTGLVDAWRGSYEASKDKVQRGLYPGPTSTTSSARPSMN